MLRLSLLLPQEVDDEGLVVHYEIIRQTLGFQVIAKMLPPLGVECFERSELRRPSSIGPIRSRG